MEYQVEKHDMDVLLEGLSLFEYLLKRGNKLPHQIVESMIEHNQDLSGVKVYLECMINDIDNNEKRGIN